MGKAWLVGLLVVACHAPEGRGPSSAPGDADHVVHAADAPDADHAPDADRAAAAIDSPALRAARRLPLAVSRVEGSDEFVLRGTFEVLENRALGSGRRLVLDVVVVPALAEQPSPSPLVFLEGGPGIPATAAAADFLTSPWRATRDILLVDMRGTGGSHALHCDLVGDPFVLQHHLAEMYPPELVTACRAQLEARADLTQYTTAHAMADLEEVRAWLGYERLDLLGLSYGGRAAFVYARAYPERVRSLVLIGPADLEAKMPLHHARLAERAFQRLCADCRADPACHAAFPQLESELYALVEQLRRAPASTSFVHPQLAGPSTLTITAGVFVEGLRRMLYDVGSRSALPWVIHRARAGDFAPFLERTLPADLAAAPFLADGAYLSITGAEDAPFIDPVAAAALCVDTLLGDYRVAQQRRAAQLWPRGELPADYFADVVLDLPTLVVQGAADPVVEPSRVLTRFSNAQLVVVPEMAHVPWGLSTPECLEQLIERFLVGLDAAALDASCIEHMQAPAFVVAAPG